MDTDQPLDELARGISDQLGFWLDPEWPNRSHALCGPAGERITIIRDWRHKDRIVVNAWLPVDHKDPNRRGTAGLTITCAIARGPEAIANDIARRVLPDYGPKLIAAQQSVEDDRAQERYRDALADVIRPLLIKVTGSEDIRRVPHCERQYEHALHWYDMLHNSPFGRGVVTVTNRGIGIDADEIDPELFIRMLRAAIEPVEATP
jgi:hypothetical protein